MECCPCCDHMEVLYQVQILVSEWPSLKLKKHHPGDTRHWPWWYAFWRWCLTSSLPEKQLWCNCQSSSAGFVTGEPGQQAHSFLGLWNKWTIYWEGHTSSFLSAVGGLGFIIFDWFKAPNIPKLNRLLLVFTGFICVLWSVFMARVFMSIKLLD